MPNHEERELGGLHIDVSFTWKKDYWDQHITAHAVITGPNVIIPLHIRASTGSLDASMGDLEERCKYEMTAMWNILTYNIKRQLQSGGLFPTFPEIEHENTVKPCPFQAKASGKYPNFDRE